MFKVDKEDIEKWMKFVQIWRRRHPLHWINSELTLNKFHCFCNFSLQRWVLQKIFICSSSAQFINKQKWNETNQVVDIFGLEWHFSFIFQKSFPRYSIGFWMEIWNSSLNQMPSWTRDVNWSSYLRSVYVLCPAGNSMFKLRIILFTNLIKFCPKLVIHFEELWFPFVVLNANHLLGYIFQILLLMLGDFKWIN